MFSGDPDLSEGGGDMASLGLHPCFPDEDWTSSYKDVRAERRSHSRSGTTGSDPEAVP